MSNAIELQRLGRDFGDRPALADVSLSLAAGESLLVLGPNGAGKTTLLRVLATLLRPSAGSVRVLGCELPGEGWRLRGRVGYLGHEPALYRDLSGRENLSFAARLHGIEGAEERIDFLLEAVAMDSRADDRVDSLSAGMRQRLALARCLLHEPELVLLDEPDSHLDAEGRELARKLLAGAATRVVVSHDPERTLPQSDRVLVLEQGGRVAHLGLAGALEPSAARQLAGAVA